MFAQLLRMAAVAVTFVATSPELYAGNVPLDRPDCATYEGEIASGQRQPRRVALAIGNAANEGTPLVNAVNDSMLITVTLQEFGWEVPSQGKHQSRTDAASTG